MRRLSLLTSLAVIALTVPLVGIGVRATSALLSDQETTSATARSAGCFVNDAAAPGITTSIVSKTTQYVGGFIKQGGAYYVYATISGTPTRVTADVRPLTAGQFLAPMTAGSYSLGGVAYNWRTAALTVGTPLAAGSYTYSVSAADAALQCRTASSTVTVDNTAPSGTDVQPNNKGGPGTTAGKPEIGDKILFTFSETIDPESVLTGWTGASTNVVVRIDDSGSADVLTVWNSTNTTQLSLGSTNLAENLVTTNTTWGASGTASTMVQSTTLITVTLGTLAGTVTTAATSSTAVWTPSATAFDRAGNASGTTNVNETGTADKNF